MGGAVFALRNRNILNDALLAHFSGLANMPRDRRNYYLSDPAFVIWLNRFVIQLRHDAPQPVKLGAQIAQLGPLFARIEARRTGRVGIPVGDTGILLQRFDLDPLVREVTPPTYDFTRRSLYTRALVDTHSLVAFAALLAEAFANIRTFDPERYHALITLVRSIGYLPDGVARSCSAARYAGIVYLAGGEESVLDLEESIVHEGAHQLLYTIGELAPLTIPGSENVEFELPWSGNRRDLFGYIHAYFIYLEVVKYYDRRAIHAGAYRPQAERIRHLIHRGLEVASGDIDSAEGLTVNGRQLFDEMLFDTTSLRRDPVPALA